MLFEMFPDWSWILTAVIGLLTLFLVHHVGKVRSLPPGPFPLPIIGNLLEFSSTTSLQRIEKWRKKYGNLFTAWLGLSPVVVVCDWHRCREALVVKRNDFAGRVVRKSVEMYLDGGTDVIFGDLGPEWETLRKILTGAIRKYSLSETLPVLVADIVDEVIDIMLEDGNPIDPKNYIYLAIYNVLASSTVGKRFSVKDEEFIALKTCNEVMNETFDQGLPSDAMSWLSIFYRKREKAMMELISDFRAFFEKYFDEHKRTYKKGTVRDFIDAVIAARDEAQEKSKDTAQYLTDKNIVLLNVDLFSAGTDTTRLALTWILLLICNEPEVQKRMQEEIDVSIGSRPPEQGDRNNCPYVHAVITETLRIKPIVDILLEHKSTCDSEIGGYKIKKGTSVMFSIVGSHQDQEFWPDPEVFRPERFLEPNGRFTNARLVGYMPFGLGRRGCPGEKLAMVDIFLIITRLLQKLNFELEGGPGTANLEPRVIAFGNNPQPYKLIVNKRI